MESPRMTVAVAALFTLLTFGGALGTQVTQVEELLSWGRALPLDSRVSREILRYGGADPLGGRYAETFAREVRSQIVSSAAERVSEILAGGCEPFIDVTIGEAELKILPEESIEEESQRRQEEFEGSLIRTEMMACLETGVTDPEEVLRIYISPEFRMEAESRIERMWTDPEGSCLQTKGVLGLVDPTRVCNRISDFRAPGVAAQHSQVVFNENEAPYQDVYFKESIKSFVRTPGGLALHYINYTRAKSLGRIERWVGAGQIEDSQKENVKELRRIISG